MEFVTGLGEGDEMLDLWEGVGAGYVECFHGVCELGGCGVGALVGCEGGGEEMEEDGAVFAAVEGDGDGFGSEEF